MSEEVEVQQLASSSMHQALMLQAVHKEQDGTFIVSPVTWLGLPLGLSASYVLNERQLPAFERWCAEVYVNAINRPLTLPEKLWSAAILIVVGITTAAYFGLIEFSVAVVSAGPLFILVCLMKLREVKTNYPKRMETFPFLDAPKTRLRYRDWLKDRFAEAVAMPLTKWIAWAMLAMVGGLLFILIATVAVGAVFGVFDHGRSDVEVILLNFSMIAGIVFFPLPVIFARRHFKTQTGYPLTTENLYLSRMGRLGGVD